MAPQVPAAVEMEVEMDEGLLPIYNVFGRIPGSAEPERRRPQFRHHGPSRDGPRPCGRRQGRLEAAARLASAEVVPLRFGSYARSLRVHLDDLRRRVVREARTPPEPGKEEESRPRLEDFAPVLEALARFETAGEAADRAIEGLIQRQDAAAADRVNPLLTRVERAFLSEDGLPGRPWFRNLIYAPGTTTGYAAWPFPELAEAVENGDAAYFGRGVVRVVEVLDKATALLTEAAEAAR